MKDLNLLDSMVCKYPSLLTGLLFASTSLLPFATPAMAQTSNPVLTISNNATLTGFIPVGSTATYQITIKNTSANIARNVKITNTLPSGFKYDKELTILTKGAVVSSNTSGYIKPASNDTTPIWDNYDIPGGGIVTVFFTANTSSATPGRFSNAVTVNYKNSAGTAQPAVTNSGSGTADDVVVKAVPPQPSLTNAAQSATAQSFTPERLCGVKPGADGVATDITGIINTYFQPALASVAAGTSNINIIGDGKGVNRSIEPGDLLLIIQMQDASINTTNSAAYGSGSTTNQGSGHTSMGRTGVYEYAIANSRVSFATGSRTLTLKNPLINSYQSSAASADSGQKRFQVIRVPQHTSIKVRGTLYASPWDGNVGGILAVDTFGKFDFNGQRISANSVGFRGGFGPQNSGLNAIDAIVSTTTTTSGSGKGEGTAGTPRFISTQSLTNVDPIDGRPIWSGGSVNNGVEGYPSGDSGRGAPANAGGAGNYHNAGGGGGGNGGIGGQGGLAWSNGTSFVPFDAGGRPGYLSSANNPVPWQLIMGGGGGGGDANNSPQGVPGGAGGGIVMLRAGTIVGTGSIFANGRNGDRGAYQGAPDGAGGAGAGGTVLIQSRNATTANLTIEAKGGTGGSTERDALYDYRASPVSLADQNSGEGVGYTADGYKYSHTPHGPGGGGAGGIVLYNAPGATITPVVTGGSPGQTDDVAADAAYASVSGKTRNTHGATAGSNGIATAFTNSDDPFNSLNNVTNCSPNLTVANQNISAGEIRPGERLSYKMTVANTASIGEATQVSIKNLLPTGFTYYQTSSPVIVLKGGSTRTTESNPVANSPTPTWGTFSIPPGGVVEITFKATVGSNVGNGLQPGYAQVIYPDPTGATTDGQIRRTSVPGTDGNSAPVKVKDSLVPMVWNVSPTIRIVRK